ncbi:hypothetical protein MAPG_04201 [Magnaporthiopsis poae ATCC 64411]|uniref:NTF2-like domain-containing protein n=1 Tax=Magnaporthiopsis poae (strain ATCC 64411 / 73-15) TaxID=644358 RepID=A0A0C4DW32_MAGP6|nr:hypothetical protein MAPG_04201 [Magnaporthiopsis poae ATCC 64411]
MRFTIPCLALAAFGAVAVPCTGVNAASVCHSKGHGKCMSHKEGEAAVEIYRKLIAEWKPEMAKHVSESFIEYSDSINTFVHRPLGGPTFPNKAAFVASMNAVPHFPVNILQIDSQKCNTVSFQWKASFGQANLPAKGLTALHMVWEDNEWKVGRIDVEFNSLIWLLNMGGSYTWEGKTYTPTSPDPTLK